MNIEIITSLRDQITALTAPLEEDDDALLDSFEEAGFSDDAVNLVQLVLPLGTEAAGAAIKLLELLHPEVRWIKSPGPGNVALVSAFRTINTMAQPVFSVATSHIRFEYGLLVCALEAIITLAEETA